MAASAFNLQQTTMNDAIIAQSKTLPGHFFVENLHGQMIFHNKAMGDYFKQTLGITSVVGLHTQAIMQQLNPDNTALATKYAKYMTDNNQVILKERRIILFEEAILEHNTPIAFPCYKAPLFDSYGYLIGLFGYGAPMELNHPDQPDACKSIHQSFHDLLMQYSAYPKHRRK